MDYVRGADLSTLDEHEFDAVILWDTDKCLIACVREPVGTSGRPRHTHTADQLYYVLRGRASVELGGDVHLAGPGDLVHIPRGAPHWQWNGADEPLVHLEVIVHPPPPGQPLVVPFEHGADLVRDDPDYPRGAVRSASGVSPGTALLSPAPGGAGAVLRIDRHEPSSAPPRCVAEHDRFHFVLEGQLQADIAHASVTVAPWHLLAIPAGVPHRIWNEGTGPARSLSLAVLDEGATTDDLLVDFAVRGIGAM
ncbi:MAG: cupin domain-containing protein [Acidimicrobiia bacterium]